jgi:hypothetical protein
MGSGIRMIFANYNPDEKGAREKVKRLCNFLYSIYMIALIPVILIKSIIISVAE